MLEKAAMKTTATWGGAGSKRWCYTNSLKLDYRSALRLRSRNVGGAESSAPQAGQANPQCLRLGESRLVWVAVAAPLKRELFHA